MKFKTYLSAYIELNGKFAWKEPSWLYVWMYYVLKYNKSLIYRILLTPPILFYPF